MKKFFLENTGLKIASVLLAIVLWLFVTSRGQSEMSIDVPLEFKNIPAGLEIANNNIKTVSLNIKGQERLIRNVKSSDIRVYVDLSKAKRGEGIYYISREDTRVPRSVTVTSISPLSVKVVTEETITKTVRIVPVVFGEPERGYYVRALDVTPQNVVIEGIRSEIAKVSNLKTEPLDVTGYNMSFSQMVKIDLTGKNIRPQVNEVSIKVMIGARTQ
ncbi:MAG: CdaR family protein [Nitrospirota bacterium]